MLSMRLARFGNFLAFQVLRTCKDITLAVDQYVNVTVLVVGVPLQCDSFLVFTSQRV